MGNYRFKISDMMPNSWFYKLKSMGRGSSRTHKITHPTTPIRKKHPKQHAPPQTDPNLDSISRPMKQQQQQQQLLPNRLSQARKSYYITREPIPSNSPQNKTHYPTDPPRRSSRRKSTRRSPRRNPPAGRLGPSPVSSGGCTCSCRESLSYARPKPDNSNSPYDSSTETELGEPFLPEFRSDSVLPTESSDGVASLSWSLSSSTCSCGGGGGLHSTPNDIEIDLKSFSNKKNDDKDSEYPSFDVVSELELPPIVTKPQKSVKNLKKTESQKKPAAGKAWRGGKSSEIPDNGSHFYAKEQKQGSPGRRISGHSPGGGMRLRVNSPKIAGRRSYGGGGGGRRSISSNTSSTTSDVSGAVGRRRSLSDSFAVVKASADPGRDFKESMVEMILQNNIWESKDLEELLACYLSLNADEYHDVIINVFKQIWIDLNNTTAAAADATARGPSSRRVK